MHYIDTDLPEVTALKKSMIATLHADSDIKGMYEPLALNALDGAAFNDMIGRFGSGPVTIVNEGLLMYLNTEEKKTAVRYGARYTATARRLLDNGRRVCKAL